MNHFDNGLSDEPEVSVSDQVIAECGSVKLLKDTEGRYYLNDMPAVCSSTWFLEVHWCVASVDGDDIVCQTDDVIGAKIDNSWHRISDRELTDDEMGEFVSRIKGGQASAMANILTGNELNGTFSLRLPNYRRFQFRICGTCVLAKGGSGVSVTMRATEEAPPTFEKMNTPMEIREMFDSVSGLVYISGPLGSGKSTLAGAACSRIATNPKGLNLISYEDPPEFDLQSIKDKTGMVAQTEIGPYGGIATYEDTIPNALRRNGDVTFFGEVRKANSMSTVATVAKLGRFVMTTIHIDRCALLFSRVAGQYPSAEQPIVFFDTVMNTNSIIFQRLAKRPGGSRCAVLEYITLTKAMKDKLLAGGIEQSVRLMEEFVEAEGVPFLRSLETLYQNGECEEGDYQALKTEYLLHVRSEDLKVPVGSPEPTLKARNKIDKIRQQRSRQ